MERRTFLKGAGALASVPTTPAVLDAVAPRGRTVSLFEFDIAGMRKSASAGLLTRLMPGTEVSLMRSLTTAAEIDVFCDVQRIGAIPSAASGAVAQLLDRGLPLAAVIRPVNEGVHHRGPVCVDIGLSVDQPTRRTQPSCREYFEAADALLEEAATAMVHRDRVGDVSTYLQQALAVGVRCRVGSSENKVTVPSAISPTQSYSERLPSKRRKR